MTTKKIFMRTVWGGLSKSCFDSSIDLNNNNSLKDKLAESIFCVEEQKERKVRALADLGNYCRRTARDKIELRKSATFDLIESIIPVLDSLSLGLDGVKNEMLKDPTLKGFFMVKNQIDLVLKQHGLSKLDPLGKTFDPNDHDCINHQFDKNLPVNSIIKVVRVGYKLGNRLIRPASVIVSSGN